MNGLDRRIVGFIVQGHYECGEVFLLCLSFGIWLRTMNFLNSRILGIYNKRFIGFDGSVSQGCSSFSRWKYTDYFYTKFFDFGFSEGHLDVQILDIR